MKFFIGIGIKVHEVLYIGINYMKFFIGIGIKESNTWSSLYRNQLHEVLYIESSTWSSLYRNQVHEVLYIGIKYMKFFI